MRVRDINQFIQVPEVAVHRINSFHDYELASPRVASESGIERSRIVVLEFFSATTRKHSAIAQAQVRSIIEDGYVVFAKQAGDGAECATESAIKKHRVFTIQIFRDPAFEFSVEISHAREHRRTAGAQTVRFKRLVGSGDDLGMIGEAEIIVGTEINDRARLAVVTNRCARFGAGEQFRLIEFNRQSAGLHPAGKGWWSLQRIAAFARDEIAQTKFCRILVHSLWERRVRNGFHIGAASLGSGGAGDKD